MIIGVDGPAGAGKTTVTKSIEGKNMNIYNLDTGAIYRASTYLVLKMIPEITEKEILEDELIRQEVIKIVESLNSGKNKLEILKVKDDENNNNLKDKIMLNDEDITKEIREGKVAKLVSPVSSIPEVRNTITEIIRNTAKQYENIIAEGRDICTVVFPDADIKIYLDADAKTRAKRRNEENKKKGIEETVEETLDAIMKRDHLDMNKEVGSLKRTDNQIYIDTTNMDLQEVINNIVGIILEKRNNK